MLKRPGGGFPPVSWPLGEETGLGGRIASRLRAPPRRRSNPDSSDDPEMVGGWIVSTCTHRSDRTAAMRPCHRSRRCRSLRGGGSCRRPNGRSPRSPARPSVASTATTWWPRSARRARRTAGPPLRSPTTVPSTPRASPAGATPSSTCSRTSASSQRNGAPGHPQTQGKIERFHQTLKRWLGRQPAALDPRRAAGLGSMPSATPTTKSDPIGRWGGHPRRGLLGDAGGRARRSSRPGSSPPALRRGRQEGCHQPAPGRPHAPPQDRRCPCPSTGPGYRRRA